MYIRLSLSACVSVDDEDGDPICFYGFLFYSSLFLSISRQRYRNSLFLSQCFVFVCKRVCVYRPQSFYHQHLSVEKTTMTTTRVTSSPFFFLSVFNVFLSFCLKFSFDAFLSTIRISSCFVVFENRVRLID